VGLRPLRSDRAQALAYWRVVRGLAAPRAGMVTDKLPQLLDCRGLMDELGVKRATAETIMRALPTVQVPGLRKVFVRRADVERFIDEHTERVCTPNPKLRLTA
jgi:hypothetical protein